MDFAHFPAIAALFALVAPACASVAGVPEAPAPGALPMGWLNVGNDDLGRCEQSIDDHRTNQTTLGARVDASWVVVFDHAILTDRRARTRSDEITLTVGWLPFGGGEDDTPRLAVGGGLRANGPYLGAEMQNQCHQVQDFRCYDLAYDDGGVTAVVYVDGVYPWYPLPWAGLELHGALLATSHVQVQADIGVRAILRYDRDQARLWFGARQRANDGDAQSGTARTVDEYERGTWIDYGASWRMFALSGGMNTDDGNTFGAVGMMVKTW
ncbi:MAG TPA: hypothetical protein VEL07_20105 [Planctomycetota bacterium]|nr:hypothetical protein [Planctomycetota bacterium]